MWERSISQRGLDCPFGAYLTERYLSDLAQIPFIIPALPGFGWVSDGAESGREGVRTGLKEGLVVRGEAAISCWDAA
jgi:hypothetical protein